MKHLIETTAYQKLAEFIDGTGLLPFINGTLTTVQMAVTNPNSLQAEQERNDLSELLQATKHLTEAQQEKEDALDEEIRQLKNTVAKLKDEAKKQEQEEATAT